MLQIRPGFAGPALLEQGPGQSLARELTVLGCQGGAIGFLRLGPTGEIAVGVTHLLLNRRIVPVLARDRLDDLLKERLILIGHDQADGRHHRLRVLRIVLQIIQHAGGIGHLELLPSGQGHDAMLLTDRALLEDALAGQRNQRHKENHKEQRGVIRGQRGRMAAELAGPLARVNASLAVIPSADAVDDGGHGCLPQWGGAIGESDGRIDATCAGSGFQPLVGFSASAARSALKPRAIRTSRLMRFFFTSAVHWSSKALSRRTAMVFWARPFFSPADLAFTFSQRARMAGVRGFAFSATNSSSNSLVASRSSSVVISQ